MNVGDSVFEYLKSSVVSGKWKPGDKIPSEKELCETLDVSRVSVRAAINRMAGIGLLESKRGGGTFVCKCSAVDSLNLFLPFVALDQVDRISMLEFRRIIEVESAALAAMRASAEMVDQMRVLNRLMENAESIEDTAKYDLEFHYAIAVATCNSAIIKVMEILSDVFNCMFRENVENLGKRGVEYHDMIINAIEMRNHDLARKYMSEHIQNTVCYRLQNDDKH